MSHGTARVANLRGAKLLVSFYLSSKASTVSHSPCENSSFLPLSGRVQIRDPRDQTGSLGNRYLKQMYFFSLHLSPFPTLYPLPPPSPPSLTLFQDVIMNPNNLQFNESPQRPDTTFWEATLCLLKGCIAWWLKPWVTLRSEYRLYHLLCP